MKAKYIQKGDSVDFVATRDMDAGEIIRLGNLIGITKIPVQAGALGTLAVSGIFDVYKQTDIAFSIGANVFWNTKNGSASSDGVFLGIAVQDAPYNQEHVQILLNYTGNLQKNQSADGETEWLPL